MLSCYFPSGDVLPRHLRDRRHDDWLPGFRWIPRAWTSYIGSGPEWRKLGTVSWRYVRKPVPAPGRYTWHLRLRGGCLRPYFAFTTTGGWHFRVGFRWDDVDLYYTFPSFAIKRAYR